MTGSLAPVMLEIELRRLLGLSKDMGRHSKLSNAVAAH